jgi:hypothetical protein
LCESKIDGYRKKGTIKAFHKKDKAMPRTETKSHREEGTHPLVLNGEERGKIWAKARGMWKNRKPDPMKELNKMRKEMDRKLP